MFHNKTDIKTELLTVCLIGFVLGSYALLGEAAPGPQSAASRGSGPGQTVAPTAYLGGPRENKILQLGIIEAAFGPAGRTPPPGSRYYTIGLRGTSRSYSAQILGKSKGDDVVLDVGRFVYLQNERGCIARPERNVTELKRPIGESITFSPLNHTEGQLAFLVPDDTTRVRLLIASAGGDGLVVPVGADFTPSWPTPIATIEDGSTMRVRVLPSPPRHAALPTPGAGRELVVLDIVIENLKADQGIEFQTSQQLRLMDAAGKFVQLSALTKQLGCRLEDGGVIPPGHSRRLMAVFDMPAGASRRLNYRGFEKDEAIVNIR